MTGIGWNLMPDLTLGILIPTDADQVLARAAQVLGIDRTVTCRPPHSGSKHWPMPSDTVPVSITHGGLTIRLRVPISVALDLILRYSNPPRRELVLLQPTLTTLNGEPLMAAYPLKLDKVAHFVLTLKNPTTGALDPVDPADAFTVVSSDPVNLQAVIDKNAAGQTTVSVNWLHTTTPMLTGVGISITDAGGNTADNAETFDMVAPDHVADQIGIDIPGVVETSQPVPV